MSEAAGVDTTMAPVDAARDEGAAPWGTDTGIEGGVGRNGMSGNPGNPGKPGGGMHAETSGRPSGVALGGGKGIRGLTGALAIVDALAGIGALADASTLRRLWY